MLRLAALLAVGTTLVHAGPCDIYNQGGTPCVAAHALTRALYNEYTGALYQVKRESDNKTLDITPLTKGGVANSASQDKFCANTQCLITIIYDQSPYQNHLTQARNGSAGAGPELGRLDELAVADAAPISLNGHKVYGALFPGKTGYRNDNTTAIPVKAQPGGTYAIVDGTHYNEQCCFDYGNAEPSRTDNGAGAMEALYFGSLDKKGAQYKSGSGPWIQADLENGVWGSINKTQPSINHRFVHGVLKGDENGFALRGGDATQGELDTYYRGPRPKGWPADRKEGGVILGIGGDNSRGGVGTFYEGAMTKGFPFRKTEDDVQKDVVAAKYAVL